MLCIANDVRKKCNSLVPARTLLVLLYAINDGHDEITGEKIVENVGKVTGEYLDYDEVYQKFEYVLDWLCELYINTLNVIHYMHDKYAYERLQMALHDYNIRRNLATGIAD